MTIDEYISSQSPEIQPALRSVREAIVSVLPFAEERMSWGMPTFWKDHNLIHFATAKNHLGIYPGNDAVEAFREELDERGLKYSKGAIRFPYGDIDLEFIRRIAMWCGEHNR
ncbi:MAG: DUF1801 domain-containing protein [Oscillospiraceae bacterium]|nr:DUF1801 domain-containing protein [Oscillospiraceae bacterium]